MNILASMKQRNGGDGATGRATSPDERALARCGRGGVRPPRVPRHDARRGRSGGRLLEGRGLSNFAGKDALFLALVDRHLDLQLEAIEQLAATTSGNALRGELLAWSQDAGSSGSFGMLMLEFWLHAARNEAVRAPLADRYARIRTRLADLIGTRSTDARLSRPPDEAASLALALDAGLFLQQLIDPAAVPPELRATAIADVLAPASP